MATPIPAPRGIRTVVDEGFRGRVLDESGVQAFRGGQRVDSGLLDSVFSAYSLLVYHPIALGMLSVGLFIFIAEFNNANGPLEIIAAEFAVVSKDPSTPAFLKGVLSLVMLVFSYLIKYKIIVGKICLVWMTYVCKPSNRHLVISIILSVLVLVKTMNYLEIALLSQIFFLYASLRKPLYKFVLVGLFVAIFVAGLLDIDKMVASTNGFLAGAKSVPGSAATTTTTATPRK